MNEYIKPVEAFKKLEAAKLLKQNVYIYGATGYGKTELIKQYFKKDKYIYIPCRQNSCDLSVIPDECGRAVTVVIDNVNAIDSDELRSEIKELCRRKKLWVIILGRSMMPSWLYDTVVTCHMLIISEEDLALNEEGIDKYMRSEGIILSKEDLRFHSKTCEGNAFAVKYAAQQLLAGKHIGNDFFEQNSIMFQSYLEKDIISELSSEIVDFLLKISIVDSFTEALASIITGNSAVYSLIERTMDSGNFIYKKNDVYTLRLQMRNALRRKAVKEISTNDLHNYAVLAGGYYESCGEDNKALELYAKYNDSDRIRELLIRNSRKNPETGYFIEMKKYYLMLSDEDIRSNAYLMSAMSMLYSMLLDFDKSEYWYNELKAYKNRTTGSKQREAICLIAYLDVGLPSRGSVNILQLIKDCYTLLTEKSLSVPEFSVTSNLPSLMNGGKDFCDWSKHDREIAATAGNIVCAFLGKYGKGLANAALAESFYEKGGDPYEIISLISKAKLEAEAGGKTELIFAANATLIRQYISHGEMDNAKELLSSFEKTARSENLHRLYPNIEAMRCRMSLYSGDMEAVGQWMKNAPDESRMFNALERYRYLTKIRCYIAYENYDRAYALIETLRYYAQRCDRKYINMELDILTSVILFRKGDEWESRFIKALEKICEYRFIPIISEEGAAVYELLNQCADSCSRNKKINREWFARVISETGRITRCYPMYLKATAKDFSKLQPMDIRILTCLADGLSIQETAVKLNMNYETLRSRIKEVYRKLDAKNKTEAVMTARGMKLI
ncbi:MAG: LuxR C-terminal-related transcriptional regulator [Oscillospiraceae bacterium]